MRAVLLAAGLAWGQASWASGSSGEWLTVTGDESRAQQDTVQVDPVAVAIEPRSRTMSIRVNRAELRRTAEGLAYRSFSARVRVRCDAREGEYLDARVYEQPLWAGPYRDVQYSDGKRPPLRLLDIEPNPLERIVRAACPSPQQQLR